MDGSESESHHEDDVPFFADMTLDLAEAHDIAVTPEPLRTTFAATGKLSRVIPPLPSIPDKGFEFTEPSFVNNPGPARNLSTDEPYDDSNRFSSIANPAVSSHRDRALPSARRWSRDVEWAAAFVVIVPLSLLLPIIFCRDKAREMGTESWMATAPAPRLATLHTLLWGYGATLLLSRLLYRTLGGGDGDDARHAASQVLLLSAPISVSVYVLLVVVMYLFLPHAWLFLLVPLWYLARDIFLFRSWKMTATTPGGRQAFFQALTCMTLDILSRSLRRSSFYRIVSFLVVVQLVVIAWWRWALLAALKSQNVAWILMAGLGGKWATGTVARLLTLIAAGGIHSWFAEQDALVQGKRRTKPSVADEHDDDMIELGSFSRNGYLKAQDDDPDDIPEAYRTADASVYRSALADDDGMDSDFEDEHEEDGAAYSQIRSGLFPTSSQGSQTSRVKQLLLQGLTRSFGSVARCGLLGGVAQLVWSQIRKIDKARATFQNLQGMSIGQPQEESMSCWNRYMLQASVMARGFVRNNSDMAMSHVAAFSKPYQRAAQDIAILIDESGTCSTMQKDPFFRFLTKQLIFWGLVGVEPMIHEDISTHMSSCVGGALSCLIVIFTGVVLVHQRNRNHPEISDSAVCLDMSLAFVFTYTLLFTVMEPLRASIKAVYISFAQYPDALSQSFPLIYHRLKRMSESNIQ